MAADGNGGTPTTTLHARIGYSVEHDSLAHPEHFVCIECADNADPCNCSCYDDAVAFTKALGVGSRRYRHGKLLSTEMTRFFGIHVSAISSLPIGRSRK